MSTLALPSWFIAAECEMQLVPEVRGFTGPYGGPSEVYDLLGDRWRMRITMPDGDFAAGAKAEAFFNRLRGGADWLALHHLARPVPRGTARGSMVLTAGVSQGGNSMALSGLLATPNLIAGGGFEIDTNVDGRADGWNAYSTGTTGSVTYSLEAGNGSPYGQQINAAGLGATTSDQAGVSRTLPAVAAGTVVTLSADVVGSSNGTQAVVYLQDGVSSSQTALTLPSGVWSRISVTHTAAVGGTELRIIVWIQRNSGGGAVGARFDNLQLELGATATPYAGQPTLLAGDMLGHGSEQLFQVYSDFTASDAGAGTVTLVNRARKAIANGQSIVWSAPTVPFMLLDAGGVPTTYRAGRSPGQTVTLEEAWA